MPKETESDEALKEFKTYHPAVNFLYFIFVLVFAMWFINPISLCISFGCSFAYLVMLKGKKAMMTNILLILPMIIAASFINAAFNHEGMTILAYLPSGNPLTLESIVYGFLASVMIAAVICYFSCYNEIMTSDKFIYLFGKIIPSLSLVLSMTLRFVPRFTAHFKEVMSAQKATCQSKKGIMKLKLALKVLSATTTWALENSIDTADSMKSRGYGTKKRTAYSIFRFDKRDLIAAPVMIFLGIYVIVGKISGAIDYTYFPIIKRSGITPYAISIYSAHFMLCIMPILIEVREVTKWKAIKSRI